MRIARNPEELPTDTARAVTIGNFDGIHIGHRKLISSIVDTGFTSTVITFDPHPRVFFGGHVAEITSLGRRLELLEEAGVDEVLVLRPDAATAALEAEEWAARYLHAIGARMVAVRENFRFGRGRAGDVNLLRQVGLEVHVIEHVDSVSSSRVRELVRCGLLGDAAMLLGRHHEVEATDVDVDVDIAHGAMTLLLKPRLRTAVLPPTGRYVARIAQRPVALERTNDGEALRARTRLWNGGFGDRLRVALGPPLPQVSATHCANELWNGPRVGTLTPHDEPYAEAESVKAIADVIAPLSGDVLTVNDDLSDRSELINQDPFGAGCLLLVRLTGGEAE